MKEPQYLLRVVEWGNSPRGVPVAGVYLLRVDGEAESLAMWSGDLSPVAADHLAESLAVLGVPVERERRSVEGPAEESQ